MHPWLIQFPPVSSYGVCLVVGIVCAWMMARRLARQGELEASQVDLMVPLVMGAGMLGAWGFGVWTRAATGEEGGLVLAGALVGATVAGIGYALVNGLPLGKLGDVVAAPAALAVAIGRVGCFLAGCCYGKVCEGVVPGVHFGAGSVALAEMGRQGLLAIPDETPGLVPVQLLESAGCLVLMGMLLWKAGRVRRGKGVSGETFLLLGIGYGVLRFGMEFLRADNQAVGGLFGRLTFSQCILPALIAAAAVTWWARRTWATQLGLAGIAEPAHAARGASRIEGSAPLNAASIT